MLAATEMLTTKKSASAKRSYFLTIMVMLALTGCMPAGPRALLEGERLVRAGQFEPAIEQLKAATELLPQNAQAWNHLGLAYHGARQATNAAQAYQRALVLDKNLAAPSYNLGCLLLEQGRAAGAIDQFKRFTMLQPASVDGWLKLASAQLRAGDPDAAARNYAQVFRLSPKNVEALNGTGVAEMHKRKLREALQFFTAAQAMQPTYRPALFNLAVVSQQYLSNRTNALQKYREYLHQKPLPADWAAVEQVIKRLELELNPSPRVVMMNQVTQLALATNALAIRTNAPPIPKLLAGTPTATNKIVALAVAPPSNRVVVALPVEKTKPATNPPVRVEAAPIVPPEPPPVRIVQLPEEPAFKPARDEKPVVVAAATPNPPAPVDSTPTTPTEESPLLPPVESPKRKEKPGILARANPVNWFRGSKSKDAPSDTAKAVLPIESKPEPAAPKLAPVRERPQFPRYTYAAPPKPAPGNRSRAEEFFTKGIEEQRARRWSSAIEAYQSATSADPAYFEALYNLGLAAYEAGDLPASLIAHERALALNPQHTATRRNFALALQKANYAPDAIAELEKIIATAPEDARARLALANLYAQQLEEPVRARPHYLKVLELEPQHPQAAAIRSWLANNL